MATIGTTEIQLFSKASLADDDDWSDPAAAAPGASRQHTAIWRYLLSSGEINQLAHGALLKVTFRDSSNPDLEKAGTFDMDVLVSSAAGVSSSASNARAAWGRIGRRTGLSSADFHQLDVGGDATIAVRLYNISATGATKVYVSARQWGAT